MREMWTWEKQLWRMRLPKKIMNGNTELLDKLRRGTPLAFRKYGLLTVDEIGWYSNHC